MPEAMLAAHYGYGYGYGFTSPLAMDPLAALLNEKSPRLLSASDLHSRLTLLEDAVKGYRNELQRRPSNCHDPPRPQPAAASSPSCTLLQLSHDLIRVVAHELCDPLQPNIAVNLSSTAKSLRAPMQAALAQLKRQHQEAEEFAALVCPSSSTSNIVQLQNATEISLPEGVLCDDDYYRQFSRAHWRTLGTLVGCGSLPMLESLTCDERPGGARFIEEGVVSLTAGLRRGGLPSLRRLSLTSSQIGDQAASALASALTKRAVPKFQELRLYDSEMGTYLKKETGLETCLGPSKPVSKPVPICLKRETGLPC